EEGPSELRAMLPERIRKEDPVLQEAEPPKKHQRYAVRALLQELRPELAPIHYEGSAPCCSDPGHRLSITHDDELVAVDITPAKSPAGIDLQKVRPEQLRNVSQRFLNRTERRDLEGIRDHELASVLNILWCAKEALYKVFNVSLRDDMHIRPFGLKSEGDLTGSVRTEKDTERIFELRYCSLGEHHIVHIADGDFL
ncbi:MAG: 4'-phosphopantetheinyl transferase superfamily protein, partial [Flavobacteriales bacterium]